MLCLAEVQEVAEVVECVLCHGVVGPFAALFSGEESGVNEFLEVVADGGLTDVEHVNQVAGAYGVAALGCYVGQQA